MHSDGHASVHSVPEKVLTALPVYNEAVYVTEVLDEVVRFSRHVLVVDDGSTDGTDRLVALRRDVRSVRHDTNRGYGAALRTAFDVAIRGGYDVLVTIDCDGQHEPQRIGQFVDAVEHADIVSGSRYLERFPDDSRPPPERRDINRRVTEELNRRLALELTDAFCGFKAYRVQSLSRLTLTEDGYAMPLELWVQAAHHQLKVVELPVPLIYLDEERSFGGSLDDGRARIAHYREVLLKAMEAVGGLDGASCDSMLCTEGFHEC